MMKRGTDLTSLGKLLSKIAASGFTNNIQDASIGKFFTSAWYKTYIIVSKRDGY